jgi:hypothetical protein
MTRSTTSRPDRNRHFASRAAATSAALVLLGGGVLGTSLTPVFADSGSTPKSTGCPEGYLTLSIADLLNVFPYRVPGMVDDPANGGNGDGIVCGNPLNAERSGTFCGGTCPATIYSFRDNNLTPGH